MLGKTNTTTALKPSNINNQDKLITENGTYTADDDYTGLGTVTVNVEGSGGDIVTAVNKTGAVINEGDKVWLQKDAQVGGLKHWLTSTQASTPVTVMLTRTGRYAQVSSKFYSLSPTVTSIQTVNGNLDDLKYMANGTTFLKYHSAAGSWRVDDNVRVELPNSYYPICDDLFMVFGRNWYLYKLNLDTFEEVKGWYFENNALTNTNIFIIGNKLYIQGKMFELPENGGTIPSGTTGTTVSGLPSSQEYMGVTSDGKYLLICRQNSLTSGGTFKIYEVVNGTTFRFVQASELPPEFEQFYNGTSAPICIFNPYTDVLTCVVKGTKRYMIAKYENGTWKVLPITIPTESMEGFEYFGGGITVSDDLSRLCAYFQKSTSNYRAGCVDLTITSGYATIPYKIYNINTDVLTGKAKASAEIGAEVEVSTVLPNEVDVTVTASEDDVTLSME